MQLQGTSIEGLWQIAPERYEDERGWFARVYCEDEFAGFGLEGSFPQHSLSKSNLKGTLRGMHFQTEPHEEIKLVACLQGSIFDVVVDMRPQSSTYLHWQGFELSQTNGRQLYIPRGCAHGFQTLSDDVLVRYMISARYAPDHACGLRYDDPAVAIQWPATPTVISDKDLNWPLLV